MIPAGASEQTARTLVATRRTGKALSSVVADNFLAVQYRNFVYGGWRQRDRWVSLPHKGIIEFHEACKALFCPICKKCGKNYRQAGLCNDAEAHDLCWRPIGSAPVRAEVGGEGEEAMRSCEAHGESPWRACLTYKTIALFPGNRWAKTSATLAELCSWPLGYRPWDDTLTAPPGSGRIWMILCQTFSSSAMLTIQPLVERYMGKRLKTIVTSSHTLSGWRVIDGPGTGDIIKVVSQDQHARTASTVSPLEGVAPAGIAVDEPITPDIRAAYARGLISGESDFGWGRELMGMTFLEGTASARAFCWNEIHQKAFNKGGQNREIWVRSGSIHENPANTKEDIRQHLDRFPPWERESREFGIFTTLKGRILPDFEYDVHVWDDAQRDVLKQYGSDDPSTWPCFLGVDPHDVRPWVIKVVALDEHDEWWVVREWPDNGAFRDMKHYRNAGVDGSFEGYAKVLQSIVDSIPGGRPRVRQWVMDPAFGDSEKAGLGQTVAKGMRQQGFYFNTNLPREVEPGHLRLRELMRGSWEPGKEVTESCHPHFHVAKSCPNMIWALLNYVNDEGTNPQKFREKPGEAGKDDVDVLRYIAMAQPRYRAWNESIGDLDRQIATLKSRMRNA